MKNPKIRIKNMKKKGKKGEVFTKSCKSERFINNRTKKNSDWCCLNLGLHELALFVLFGTISLSLNFVFLSAPDPPPHTYESQSGD